MSPGFFIRCCTLTALSGIALWTSAQAQSPIVIEAATLVQGTLFLADPPSTFAIHRQQALPLVVGGGELRNAAGVGVTLGVRLIGDFGVEGMFSWTPVRLRAPRGLESHGNEADMNALTYGATVLYYLPRFSRVEPFAGVGVGAETFSYDPELAWERRTELTSNALAGAHLWLGDRISLRLEARHFLVPFGSDVESVEGATLNNLVLSTGVSFRAPL